MHYRFDCLYMRRLMDAMSLFSQFFQIDCSRFRTMECESASIRLEAGDQELGPSLQVCVLVATEREY
jgi:hypothetical protein